MSTDAKPTSIAEFEGASIEDAETVRWLTAKLGPARIRALEGPGTEVIARMRARILDEASHKRHGKIAA